jgi:MFS family permease
VPNNNNGYPSATRAWVTVAILMVAYVLSFIDRQILNLLVGPIRRDLMISDTQMSLLMGLSFALFYTVCGIPLGRLADTKSRRGLIAIGVLFWSAATAACGMAKLYWQFLICRIGVGVGEAALSPAAYSLIADSFPAERRATAISVYSMGVYLGSGIAFLLGGLVIKFASAQGDVMLPVLGEVRPWQLIFLILGAAGVLFTLLMLAVREPARRWCRCSGAAGGRWALYPRQPPHRAVSQLWFRRAGVCRLWQRGLGADLLYSHLWLGCRPGRYRLRQHRGGVRLPGDRLRRPPGGLDGQAR